MLTADEVTVVSLHFWTLCRRSAIRRIGDAHVRARRIEWTRRRRREPLGTCAAVVFGLADERAPAARMNADLIATADRFAAFDRRRVGLRRHVGRRRVGRGVTAVVVVHEQIATATRERKHEEKSQPSHDLRMSNVRAARRTAFSARSRVPLCAASASTRPRRQC